MPFRRAALAIPQGNATCNVAAIAAPQGNATPLRSDAGGCQDAWDAAVEASFRAGFPFKDRAGVWHNEEKHLSHVAVVLAQMLEKHPEKPRLETGLAICEFRAWPLPHRRANFKAAPVVQSVVIAACLFCCLRIDQTQTKLHSLFVADPRRQPTKKKHILKCM